MNINAQRLLPLFSLLLLPLLAWATPIDVETAREKAEAFLYGRSARSATDFLELRYSTPQTFLFENTTGFALIAADDELPEVLGYGTKSNGQLPPALIDYLKATKFAHTQVRQEEITPVEALLPFVRHQNAPYNNYCPFYKNHLGVTKYRCVVGCVATALEEIISYYRRTVILQDTLHGWEGKGYTDIPDILPGTTVDCKLIRNNYDVDNYTEEEADAVARLSFYCGVAAKMNWGISSSGANIKNLITPLQKAFGYGYVEYVDSYKYAPKDWFNIIKNEIYAHRPVLYTAFNMWLSGHAFVIDGIDPNGFFHVNWGYAGSYDGYFRLDVLNYNEPPEQMTPEGMEAGFFSNHQALLLHPDKVTPNLPDTLARTGYEIVVDSVHVELVPETGKHTPMSVYIRNTTDQYLTTPFEFFTNLAEDTALVEQGDFIALGAAILAPHEQRKMTIHAQFDKAGERFLHISPDDVAILYNGKVHIKEGKEPTLTFHEPEIDFLKSGEALVTLHVSNADTAGRSGQEVLYEVGPGDAETVKDGVRHSRHLYVLPGQTVTDTVTFHYLEPGTTYTLLVRSPWKVQTQKTFTVPTASAIPTLPMEENPHTIFWYSIDGRRVKSPTHKGIYLRRQGHHTEKIYIQ